MYKRYLVMCIGCIECGIESAVCGMFGNKEFAEEVASKLQTKLSWRHGGQNSFEVFDLEEEIEKEIQSVMDEK